MSVRLGEILIKESLITQDQLEKALEFQRSNGGKLGSCLTKMGFITDDDITGVLSRQYGVPSINLKYYEIDPNVIKLIPQDTALRYQVIPLSRVGSVLTIAMTDPTNVFAMDDIKFMTGFNVEPVVASESAIGGSDWAVLWRSAASHEELSTLMKDLVDEDQELELAAEEQEMDAAMLEKAAEEAPIIKLVNLILTDSVKRGASDIHVEPYENEMRVRFRVDGVLQTVMSPPLKLRDAITSRMKIMAKLDIAEKRLPQDGRIMIKYKAEGQKEGIGLPRIDRADTVRRKDCAAVAGQRKPAPGHDQARFRAGIAEEIRTKHFAAVRHGAGHRANGIGQDQHAVLFGVAPQPGGYQHHDRGRSGRIPIAGNQPGADEGSDRVELRGCACAPSCGKTRTSFWSVRFETLKRRKSR